MRFRGAPVALVITLLFLSTFAFIFSSSGNVSALEMPVKFIGVSGTNFTKDGVPFGTNERLVGVDDTTAWVFAINAYCNGVVGDWGKNMNFPSEGGQMMNISTLTQLWNTYFWYANYYNLNIVRFSSGDDWATEICYLAWLNHPTEYYQVLYDMMKQAWSVGIYIDLNMAGSAEYPLYNFAGTGTVFDLSHSVGTAYHNYLDYLNATMIYCDACIFTDAIFSYDVWNEPDHNSVNTGYWSGNQIAFRTWAKEVCNDTIGMSTHIIEMGVSGQSNLFGWGYNSFYNATGSIGFDVCDRHYYANAETNDYLIHDPIGWANTSGKPLVWSELGKSITPLTRWSWFEGELISHGAKVWCNMVLTGTDGYPDVLIPFHSTVTSVVLYHYDSIIANFTQDGQAVTIPFSISITKIEINVHSAGTDAGFNIEVLIHLLGTGGTGWVGTSYSVSITGYFWGDEYNHTFSRDLTDDPFNLNQSGMYEVVMTNDYHVLTGSPSIRFQEWNGAILSGAQGPVHFTQDKFGIGANIEYFAWLLIVFLPAMILNSVLPKIGFIAGLIIMSIALTATNTITGWWVLIVMFMGITILIYRGDEN